MEKFGPSFCSNRGMSLPNDPAFLRSIALLSANRVTKSVSVTKVRRVLHPLVSESAGSMGSCWLSGVCGAAGWRGSAGTAGWWQSHTMKRALVDIDQNVVQASQSAQPAERADYHSLHPTHPSAPRRDAPPCPAPTHLPRIAHRLSAIFFMFPPSNQRVQRRGIVSWRGVAWRPHRPAVRYPPTPTWPHVWPTWLPNDHI